MGVSRFGPALHFNLNEFQRRLGEVAHGTSPNDAPSKLPRKTSTRLPHPALSRCAANTLEGASTGEEATKPLDVQPSPQSHLTHDAGTSIFDLDDSRAFDVDNFRRWWRRSSTPEAAEDRSRERKRTRIAIAFAGIALIGSALTLRVAPTLLKTPPLSPPANDIARVQNLNGETTGTPSDISTTPRAGLSGATPIAREVAAQTVEGLASKASAQATDPVPARSVSVRPDWTRIASQVSSASERWSAAYAPKAPKPPKRPSSERMNGAARTTQPSTDSTAKHPGKPTARVVVAKAEADELGESADTPIPPLPIRTRAKVAKASGPTAPATSAEAAKRSSNPLLYVLGDLLGD
jgi:hypothetical protein